MLSEHAEIGRSPDAHDKDEWLFALRPAVGNLKRIEPGAWLAHGGPVCFELDPGARAFPEGWVLLTCRLTRTILDGSAQLLVEHDAGSQSIPIPVSLGGSVYELVKLPAGIRRLRWQPSQGDGSFEHTPLRARKLPLARRLWLMVRRVAYMLWTRPSEEKRRAGLGWLWPLVDLTGQYRACGRLRTYAHSMPYARWLERYDVLSERDRRQIRRRARRLRWQPHFAVLVMSRPSSGRALAATLASLDAQLYRNYSVAAAEEMRVQLPPQADFVMLLDAGDRLAEHALYWLAEAIARRRDVALAYADEDVMAEDGARSEPQFKPDWSPEHLRSINYVGRCIAFRRRELELCGAELAAGDAHELALRFSEGLAPRQIVHVAAVLLHRSPAQPRALPRPRVRHGLPARPPLVSVIIPTRDAPVLLRTCIDSIRQRSSYANYEILAVDNDSRDPHALAYLDSLAPPHRVLRYAEEFNYAAINNLAARAARGAVLLLLNNDTEVISPDWMEEMLGHLHRDGVGVVGAKLYYGNNTVQHAGDAVGPGGCSAHMHNGLSRDEPGYCHRAVVAQEVSAVTGACLMTWRDLYLRVGGLDAAALPLSFNDVDYCLRVQETGYRVVFTPHAQLYHHESATRSRGFSVRREARDVRTMRKRWGRRLRVDPYYNPNLSDRHPDFSFAGPPRLKKPWLA